MDIEYGSMSLIKLMQDTYLISTCHVYYLWVQSTEMHCLGGDKCCCPQY